MRNSIPARDPAQQTLMTLKALLSRKVRVRERKIGEMDGAIEMLRMQVAEAERDYAKVKKARTTKTQRRAKK